MLCPCNVCVVVVCLFTRTLLLHVLGHLPFGGCGLLVIETGAFSLLFVQMVTTTGANMNL